ncbi:hypothetical protein C0583_01205 [Candidatus Parcubacteria bacterium]|nr:MAG: hypothetical protein C0583_01205 [Candidatus Parcubacteria bacterium]
MSRRQILILDNEIPILTMLDRYLNSKVKKVLLASNIEEAKEAILNNEINIVLSDINLGNGKTGFDFYNWVCSNGLFTGIKYIFMSANMSGERIKKIKNLQCLYIEKPFNLKKLDEIIE